MNNKVNQIKLSYEAIQQKIRSWCAYQERSQHETRNKLIGYGLSSEETEELIAGLISENFLNEERFAIAYAGGKFRMKQWGRNKIRAELKSHRVSEPCISRALGVIDEKEYAAAIEKVIHKKIRSLKGKNVQNKFYSVLNYLISRGFEGDLVRENLGKLREENGFNIDIDKV